MSRKARDDRLDNARHNEISAIHTVICRCRSEDGIAAASHNKFLDLCERIHLNSDIQGPAKRAGMAFQGLPKAMVQRGKDQIKLLNITK